MPKRYQISDGRMLLTLQPDSHGWFVVTSPTDPAMITQARSIEEAFSQARDAFAAVADSRTDADRCRRPIKKLLVQGVSTTALFSRDPKGSAGASGGDHSNHKRHAPPPGRG